jgi:ATP-binding protein involved in chromosome partitioning
MTEAQIKEALSKVIDPLLEHDIVNYRIYRTAEVQGDDVLVRLDIPTHAYPLAQRKELAGRVEAAVKAIGAKRVTVIPEVVTAYLPAPSDKAVLKGPKNVIAVAAGKGGVGKSTVAVNLALALAKHGAKVGLLDADVFGPSIPTMLGQPEVPAAASKEQRIIPAMMHGLRVISVGYFVDKDEAVVWRGPMVHRLLQQFLGDVDWGELDYLVCDLPPGTGDVQLSMEVF